MYYETISETVAAYDNMLDECYPDTKVGDVFYDYSYLLNKLDPTAYKCGWIDWCDDEGVDTDELEDDYTFDRDRL